MEKSRQQTASLLKVKPNEVIFTSGASEANSMAIKGICFQYQSKGKHIITSNIEHHAILHTCQYLEKKGYEVTYLDVDEYGTINLKELEKSA